MLLKVLHARAHLFHVQDANLIVWFYSSSKGFVGQGTRDEAGVNLLMTQDTLDPPCQERPRHKAL